MSTAHRPLLTFLFSIFTAVLYAAPASAAAFSPLQIGLGPTDWQLVSTNTPVIGLRLNLPKSVNNSVAGLDIGLFSLDTVTFTGLGLNLVDDSRTCHGIAIGGLIDFTETLIGLQFAPVVCASDVLGIQAGAVAISSLGHLHGVQLGLFIFAEDLWGVQIGLFNNGQRFLGSPGTIHGGQLGLLNVTGTINGLQIGIVNIANDLQGLQIGLLNCCSSSSISCLPLLRASF